jgi:hypothetical protein
MPYAHYCLEAAPAVLRKGDFVSESLFVAAGLEGWDVSEPGEYLIQAALHLPGEDVISAPLSLRVASPESAKEESLAQDYFSDDVGRVLAFDGSQHLRKGNDTLRELVDTFGNHPAACHAQVALAVPLTRRYQLLADDCSKFTRTEPKLDDARKVVASALLSKDSEAAETLGHVDYGYYVDHLASAFDALGDEDTAKQLRGAKGSVAKKRAKLDADLDQVLGLSAAVAAVEAAE